MAQNEGCDSAGNLDAIKRYLIERGRM